MTALTFNEVLAASFSGIMPTPEPQRGNTALLLIDIQELAAPEYFARAAIAAGMESGPVRAALADYTARFDAAIANCATVLAAARAAGVAAIHVKIQALAGDGRDTGALHRRFGWCHAPGTEGTGFLPETAPAPGEIVITKTASGAFTGTTLDFTLRNLAVEHLDVCGFLADECVETTVRQALDLGYHVRLIADATSTFHGEATDFVVAKFGGYGFTQKTAETVESYRKFSATA